MAATPWKPADRMTHITTSVPRVDALAKQFHATPTRMLYCFLGNAQA